MKTLDTSAAEAAMEALLSELRDDDGNLLAPVTAKPGAARERIEQFIRECCTSSTEAPPPAKSAKPTSRTTR